MGRGKRGSHGRLSYAHPGAGHGNWARCLAPGGCSSTTGRAPLGRQVMRPSAAED